VKAEEAVIAWNPVHGDRALHAASPVAVVPRTARHLYGSGTPHRYWIEAGSLADGKQHGALAVLLHFHTLVVRDGIAVDAAHRAFLAIDEYRASISPDVEGAE
jgi:hypothetical protein